MLRASYREQMDKLVFLMQRKADATAESFHEHYLEFHSLLGLRLVPTLDGYTVNITDVVDAPADDPHHPDAVVEMWTRDINVFMDMDATFAAPEDRAIVIYDDASFIGTTRAWQVEEQLLFGGAPDGPLRARADGVKRMTLLPADADLASAPGVVRAVAQRIVSPLLPGRVGETLPGPGPVRGRGAAHRVGTHPRGPGGGARSGVRPERVPPARAA